jgi:two-component system, chemotaxis family, sensor kinase CheA
VSQDDYQRLLDAVKKRQPMDTIERLLRGLRREPVEGRFQHAKALLLDSSVKLGKTPPRVEIRHDGLRIPPGPWAPFWTIFAHVLNNAVDHGIEGDAERRAAGKPMPAEVSLSAFVAGNEIVIEVRDDGCGIDWARVRELATERGLPSQTRQDLEQALFADGFSLRRDVSETSGRGVGLAAVRNVVSAMGGKIEVESTEKVGTTWRFRFSSSTLGHAGEEDEEGLAPRPNLEGRAVV